MRKLLYAFVVGLAELGVVRWRRVLRLQVAPVAEPHVQDWRTLGYRPLGMNESRLAGQDEQEYAGARNHYGTLARPVLCRLCLSSQEILDTHEAWKAAMMERGWRHAWLGSG